MALKFNCPECNFQLVVKFLKPGETAKCYSCGSYVTVPYDAEPTDSELSILKPVDKKFYTESRTEDYAVIPPFGDALSFAWKVIKKNYDLSIGIAVVYFIASLGSSLSQLLVKESLGEGFYQFLISTVIFGIIITLARTGLLKIALGFAFEETAKPSDFKATLKQYVRCYLGSLLYTLMVLIGLIFLIVPGVILAVRYQFYDFFILKYDLTLLGSFGESAKLTEKFRNDLFGFNFVAILFGFSGLIACCIGTYITFPISTVAWAYVFTRLIKEKNTEFRLIREGLLYEEPEDTVPIIAKTPRPYPTIWQAIMLLVLYIVLEIFVFIPVGIFEEITELPLMDFTPLEIALSIIVLALIILFLMRKTGRSLKDLASLKNFNLWILLPVTATILGVGILSSELDNILSFFLPKSEWFKEFIEQLRSSLLGYISLAIIFAPVTEEFLFRGVIVRGFADNYSFKKTILVSALLFGLVYLNPWQFLGAFMGGIILAWMFIETKSIVPCIYAHALHNGLDLILYDIFHLEIPGFTVTDPDKILFQPWWFDLLGILLVAGGVMWLYILFNKKKNTVNNNGNGYTGGFRIE